MAISMKHKSITIDVNNRNAPNVVAIANVNDKAVRYLDVTLTASGEKLTFTDCTATATFATDGYLISDAVACTLNSTADLITVPLENFKSMSGFLAIEIKIANGETQILNTPLTLKVKVTPSLAENSKINNESIGSFVDISREVATARGEYDNLNQRLDTFIPNDEPGQVETYNLADGAVTTPIIADGAVTLSKLSLELLALINSINNKADKATTLEGYGIRNAFTKTEVALKLQDKYDASNIESGTSTLTPYSTVADKIKSANCTYKTIGDIVIVSAVIVMNAITIGANSVYPLIDLPYKHTSDSAVYCVGISSGNKLFKGSVPKNNTWLQFAPQDKVAYTFTQDEQINFSLLYKIK